MTQHDLAEPEGWLTKDDSKSTGHSDRGGETERTSPAVALPLLWKNTKRARRV